MALLEPDASADRVARLRRRRRALERVVEKALERLDRIDGDPDLEPSLGATEALAPLDREGWTRHFHPGAYAWAKGSADDREDDADHEESLGWSSGEGACGRLGHGTEEAEPSLAGRGLWAGFDQREWAFGGGDDREGDEHDGREPDEDGEPSLGSQEDGRGGTTWNMVGSTALVLDGEQGPGPNVRAAQLRAGARRRRFCGGWRLEASPAQVHPASELLDPDETAGPSDPRAEAGMGGSL